MADDSLIFVRERNLDFPVFDADNHMYENTDAFTKFLPPEYEGVVKYIDDGNRSKLAMKDRIEPRHPEPDVPAGGASRWPAGRPPPAPFDQRARRVLRRRASLQADAGVRHQPVADVADPRQCHRAGVARRPARDQAVFHALNQWMYEHWTFGYENAIFPTPAICMAVVDQAIEELEWVAERGARIVYIRPAPVIGPRGRAPSRCPSSTRSGRRCRSST